MGMLQRFLLALNASVAAASVPVMPYFDDELNSWFQSMDIACSGGSECEPWQEQLVSLPWPSETGDSFPPAAQDPRHRYNILNSDASNLVSDCASASWNGSAARTSPYPYFWWEPSSQDDIVAFFSEWQTCATRPPAKANNADGVAVVTNLAPEMFETFASGFIDRGGNRLILANHTRPQLAVVPSTSSTYDHLLLVAAQADNNNASGTLLSCYGLNDSTRIGSTDGGAAPTLLHTASIPQLRNFSSMSYDARTASGDAVRLLLIDTTGILLTVQVNTTDGALTPVSQQSLPLSGSLLSAPVLASCEMHCGAAQDCVALCIIVSGSQPSAALAAVQVGARVSTPASWSKPFPTAGIVNGGASITLLPSSNNDSTGALSGLVAYSLSWNNNSQASPGGASPTGMTKVRDLVAALCAVADDVLLHGDLSSCAAHARSQILHNMTTLLQHTHVHARAAQPLTSNRSELYAVNVQLTLPSSFDGSMLTCSISGRGVGAAASRIGFGAQPHLTSRVFGNEQLVLLSTTDATCQCGLGTNNGDTPLCHLPFDWVDTNWLFYTLQSVSFLLQYNFGKLSAFQSMVSTPASSGLESYLSMCHPHIFNAKFETGASVAGALYVRNTQWATPNGTLPVRPEVAAMFAHDGNVMPALATILTCGLPSAKPGVVLDQFALPQPAQLTSPYIPS